MAHQTNPINFILTDTLPAELPLIFSNKTLYKYLKNNPGYLVCKKEYKDMLKRTIPTTFYIKKSETSFRKMSLMHPYMQILSTKFINDYASLIITYFKHNKLFSMRTPISINDKEKVIDDKYIKEISDMFDTSLENQNDDLNHIITNYFNLSRFPKLTDFYRSYYLKDLELKYNYLVKLDVRNCFESIYTHSVDWAYLGKKAVAKDNINNDERFSAILDTLMQYMNYAETNSILIGPEFSRTFAEIILTRLDNNLYYELLKHKLYYKKDYEIIRFIDDIYIFTNSIENSNIIEQKIELVYSEYKLSINHDKRTFESKPFLRQHMWVTDVKRALQKYSTFCTSITNQKHSYDYDQFYDDIRKIIVDYEPHKPYIISYITSALENILNSIIKVFDSLDVSMQYYHSCKFIDVVTQIVNFSITNDNINKLSRIFLKLANNFLSTPEYSLDEIIYKKAYLLINFNRGNIVELQNLIITLSFNKEKNLPPDLLLEILENNNDYLIISIITFYVNNIDSHKIYYANIIDFINTKIDQILTDCADYFGFNYKAHHLGGNTTGFVLSDYLYIIHDFYSSGILNNSNMRKIKKIKKNINSLSNSASPSPNPYSVFLNYIKDFDKPFINWKANYNNIVTDVFLQKQYKHINYN